MLTISNVSKSFPGVKALSGVQLQVKAGEIHALVGENGAGKSTLTKVIAGVYQADEGQIEFDGEIIHWASPAEAKAAGVHVIYQEFILFPNMTVAENIFIGHERRSGLMNTIDHGKTCQDTIELLKRLGVWLDPNSLVSELSVADQQMVEIAKAMVHKVKLLILDEPTAVIAGKEVQLLFERLRTLRDDGVAILYISHRMEEIFDLCDKVTVLKDGQFVTSAGVAEISHETLVATMVGRNMTELFPPKADLDVHRPVVLSANDISVKGRVHNATIELRAGEITALAGMVGAGRTELALALFGGLPMTGKITIDGKDFARMTPARAIELGIGFLTEDRKGQGLAMLQDVAVNITASGLESISNFGWLVRAKELRIAETEIESYHIACRGPQGPVLTMSGGNQQKVLVSRWARTSRKVIIMDEPTRGVDVGAKAEIYRIMRKLANNGLAVLMISSEMPEVIGLADRVFVMCEGVITGVLRGDEVDERQIIQLATQRKAT